MNDVTVNITGAGSELQGVGRLEDGRAVFIPGALPGEQVRAEITAEKERFAQARLTRVLTPSPERTESVCPHYPACGGCRARHMTYELSLRLKRDKVYNALTRIGGLTDPPVTETLPSPITDGYRNKAEFACAEGRIGVFEEGSNRVIDTSACLLQTEGANRLLPFIKARMGRLPIKYIVVRTVSSGEMMLTLSLSYPADISALAEEIIAENPSVKSVYSCRLNFRPAHALDGECRLVKGRETLTETLCGLKFSLSPQSFFQVNRPQAEKLYETALNLAELSPSDRVCDIYCGAGTISLAALKHCARVTGIEIVPPAVRDAKANAKANGLDGRSEFLCGDAAKLYPPLAGKFDCVITDPPRKGMDKPVVDALIAKPAKKLVYVSCDPGTLARDIKLLTASGAYKFERAVPADMFPWTGHVETVCLLSGLG